MINNELVDPKSIVVVGGSNDITKPGGKVLKNLIDGAYKGNLMVMNIHETEVQGIICYQNPEDLPDVELAIIAIAAKYTYDIVKLLSEEKHTRAFIILSAGFSEVSEEGKVLEQKIVDQVNKVGASLIGPNCIGVLTPNYHGVFTKPIPKLDPKGCDFISGSGATACFIMEAGIPKGLTFANVFSVGNSGQMGVEEILRYMDETFDPVKSSKVKLLYLETMNKPQLLLKHASSLIKKGCKIVAIKAGTSEAGSRAATSHTGALASPDVAVDALFKKAGIVRCYSREEMITIASIFMHPELKGKKIAVITHAGGPAVMLTDTLSAGGLEVPLLKGPAVDELKEKLFPGSSVANPIDFLATGTAEQMGIIIDTIIEKFPEIDGMVVIFGTPGLFPINRVYGLLDDKMHISPIPIYPVLPSTLTAEQEVAEFLAHGRINFPDGVIFGKALSRVFYTPKPVTLDSTELPVIDNETIRKIIDGSESGYLSPEKVQELLDAAGISRAQEALVKTREEAIISAEEIGYPVVMKVVGPVHKSDVGGVVLNIEDEPSMLSEFNRMTRIKDARGVLIQPMLSGTELFIGAKYEDNFGHLIMCGLGGIFIEVLKDVQTSLSPVSQEEALRMISDLKGKKILEGVRGQEGVDMNLFADIIVRVSALVETTPEILEMDINPLLGKKEKIIAVDARINIHK
ncbi:MAG: acetate--CoA ligase family protein [Bacteroidales bacterium]|nr:acetate--CoA ligase family protein [Bacteroidales bacterium]